MRVLLRAPFNRYSGYGNDGIDIARFLDRAGVDVYPWPTAVFPGLPLDFVPLLAKTPRRGAGAYDVALQFAPPFDIRVQKGIPKVKYGNLGLPHEIAPVHVGWSMWEKTKIVPSDMVGHGVGKYPWKHLDWLYVTCQMNVEAFAAYDPKVEYRVLPCGIDGALYPVSRRDPTGPTKFCMIGQLHERKDPYVAVQAFSELKREHGDDFDAELHLKTNIVGLPPQLGEVIPGLFVHVDHWEYSRLIEWMHTMHCYVGPSKGEGNLKPPMEFMATGGTVIVTNWSGPENWLHPDFTYPLDYELMPVDPEQPEGPWEARASIEHLKALMWHVHTNRREASDKGIGAAEWIRWVSGWDKIIDRLVRDLEEALRQSGSTSGADRNMSTVGST
jgi:glycosyltransferase involved in cell wall biosynthesis